MTDNRKNRLKVLLNLNRGLENIEKLIDFFKANYNEENIDSSEMKKALDYIKDLNSFNKEFNEEDMNLDSILKFLEEAKKEQIDFIDKYMDYMDLKLKE